MNEDKLLRQIEIVNNLTKMVNDDLADIKINVVNCKHWKQEEHSTWDEPERFSRTRVNRLMLMLRQESIKLEKMMIEFHDYRNYKRGTKVVKR